MEASAAEVYLGPVRHLPAFRLLLEFCYTGKIAQPIAGAGLEELADSVLGVLELADLYSMEPLFLECTRFLKQRVCHSNCVNWLRFTQQLPNCSALFQACLAYFCRFDEKFRICIVDRLP